MLSIVRNVSVSDNISKGSGLIPDMWRDRKTVFVDTLGWDVPVVGGAFEIDQFDDEHAVYLVVSDQARRRHLASLRLLPSVRPHILGDIFPGLCAGPVPRGPSVWEITRLCISPAIGAVRQAMLVRRELALGLLEYALAHGIAQYTQVHLGSHLPQLLAVGWDCTPLGFPAKHDGQTLMASRIAVSASALEHVRTTRGVRHAVSAGAGVGERAAMAA